MSPDELETPLPNFGSWKDAENLRKWSFLQRTPQQRLDWLMQALTIAYQMRGSQTSRSANRSAIAGGAVTVFRPAT